MTKPDLDGGDNSHRVAAAELRSFCERIEKLEEEKSAIGDDIKDVFTEAKDRGYDAKVMKEMLKLRAMDANKRAEREALRSVYAEALGVFA